MVFLCLKHTFRALLVFTVLTMLPVWSHAETGDNCSVNIAGFLPDDVDWRDAYIIKGADGYAWQRAIINKPLESLLIEEGRASKVVGTARPHAEVQVFLFTPSYDEFDTMVSPTDANCFEAGQADGTGLFELPIQAGIMWSSLGQEVAVDAFYRMEKSWDQLKGEVGNRNFSIGTHMSMVEAAVVLPGFDEDERQRDQILCETETGVVVKKAVRLDPFDLREGLRGGNFLPVQERVVAIGKVGSNTEHTFFGGLEGEIGASGLGRISLKAATMELLKRILMADSKIVSSSPGIDPVNVQTIEQALAGDLVTSQETIEVLEMIQDLLIGDNITREQVAGTMAALVVDTMSSAESAAFPMHNDLAEPDLYLELFPAGASLENTWIDDYIEMLRFWTESETANYAIIANDHQVYENFSYFSYINGTVDDCGSYPSLYYLHGYSPRLLIDPEVDLVLEPDFTDLVMTYADTPFHRQEAWDLSAGMQTEIYYEYRDLIPIKAKPVAEYCVRHADIPVFAAELANSLSLRPSEQQLLVEELDSQIPENDEFHTLSLLDPADISRRFSWRGNGQKLNIQQLFFRQEQHGCSALTPVDDAPISIDPGRDGLETGFVFS